MLAVAGILFTEFFGIAQPWWDLGNKVHAMRSNKQCAAACTDELLAAAAPLKWHQHVCEACQS